MKHRKIDYRKIPRLSKTIFSATVFLARNLWMAKDIPVFSKGEFKDVEFHPCTKELVPYIVKLYKEFHSGKKLDAAKENTLKLVGHKLCLVVKDKKTQRIAGYSLYYFNHRDIKEATVHEGDTALLQEYRGRGIGTAQRLHALRHFARCPFIKGVSSRVSLNNLASLKSNQNLGFREQERYFDKNMGEERAYLVCELSQYRKNPTTQELGVRTIMEERIPKK